MGDVNKERVLVLRTCNADGTSRGGFKWPESGPVEAPDWDPIARCGSGLHGALRGEGDGSLLDWSPEARWLVISVLAKDIVDLEGKVKFPRGEVVYCGTREGATKIVVETYPGRAVIGAVVQSGDYGTATAGDYGTATAGYRGTATAGDYGTATAGDDGTATAGDDGEIRIRWYDEAKSRYRTEVAYVGENGIEPNVAYVLDAEHKFVKKATP